MNVSVLIGTHTYMYITLFYFYYYSVCRAALPLNVHVHVLCNSRSNSTSITSAAPTHLEQALKTYNYASTQESPTSCIYTLSIRCLLTWQLSGFVVLYWIHGLAFVLLHDYRKMHRNNYAEHRMYTATYLGVHTQNAECATPITVYVE